ncbi:MAG: LysM peptidoglycan-binding domain-containing protein [Nitrospirae bacterium]|nr:LysM peptidoglycan-binding domain-containing protein [Nitrospirota bacterium]
MIVLFIFLNLGCSLSNTYNTKNGKTILPQASQHETKITHNKEEAPQPSSIIKQEKVTIIKEEVEPAAQKEADAPAVENTTYDKTAAFQDDADINPAEEEGADNSNTPQDLLDAALDFCDAAQEHWTAGNPEKAVESLDEAYNLVLKVDTESHPELIQQKEDLRFMVSKRILEIYASRYTTVNGNHKEIPLTINEHVEKEIKSFQGVERDFFTEGLKRSGRYRGEIVKALKEAGLPEELSWLPLIESWFKVSALSPARALGIWQFIPSTGYKFGLKRDTWIDERMDPKKATTAAIAYLRELHQMFGDWTTVLAGYNCGEGTVLRIIRNQKINYLDNFWDLYERLPRETARYVPRFLATLHIMKDPAKYGFNFEELDSPPLYESIAIEKPVQLKTVADSLGVSPETLALLNPELRRQATPPARYSLNVPIGTGNILLAKLDTIETWAPPKNEYGDSIIYHTVKRGETLSRIAAKYRTSVDAIIKANKISRKRKIIAGQKLKIPVKGGKGDTFSLLEDLLPGGKYRIKKGETLRLVAKKFNTDTARLKLINSLNSSLLYEGQVLKVTE